MLSTQASSVQINPLYFMIAVTISASFAFMLPVATPPNAIVFAYGHLKIIDMVCNIVPQYMIILNMYL